VAGGGAATKRAVAYLRVSSSAQADKDYDSEGFSLPAQRQRKAASLGAEVVESFVERGESGTSTNGRRATAMLARLGDGDIDYVIVHKVDRLARKRADDAAILQAIRDAGTTLISVSQNIDETPSGMLLHGIMAAIAEFYSMNLAAEVMKGTTEKAKRGGTPGRPPIGYLNVREVVDGREIRTIAVDPKRDWLVTLAFRLYATGDYSLSELAAILEAKGLRNRPRRGRPVTALGVNRLSALLRHDYYIGVVTYAGLVSKGRHPCLTDEATFQRVQEVLDSQRKSGERCWRHHHYLRGSVFCGECDGRLIYTRATGRSGATYEYFVCSGRQEGTCSQPHHRVEAVERAIEDEYARIQLSEQRRETIRAEVRAYVAALDGKAEPEREQVEATLKAIAGQGKKLLQAHYDDLISSGLFAEEQQRLRRERVAAEQRQAELQADHRVTLERLELALSLTDRVQAAYMAAEPQTRRVFNPAIFSRIWIDREEVADRELAVPLGICWRKI
jgi:DNA invertase Pin-like site-specific DNA recombinase